MAKVIRLGAETPYILSIKELVRAVRALDLVSAKIHFEPEESGKFWREYLIPTQQENKVRLVRAGFWRSSRGLFHLDGVTFEWDWEEMLHWIRESNGR